MRRVRYGASRTHGHNGPAVRRLGLLCYTSAILLSLGDNKDRLDAEV